MAGRRAGRRGATARGRRRDYGGDGRRRRGPGAPGACRRLLFVGGHDGAHAGSQAAGQVLQGIERHAWLAGEPHGRARARPAARDRAPLPQGSPGRLDRSARPAGARPGIGAGKRSGDLEGCPARLARAPLLAAKRGCRRYHARSLEKRVRAGTRTPGSNVGGIQRARNPLSGAGVRSAVDERHRSPGIERRSRRHGDRGLPQWLRMEWRSVSNGAGEGFVCACGRRKMSDLIAGIDLGTTNSEIAAFTGGQVRVLGPGDTRMLPSCVGFSSGGELLVGEAARNQQALYPERTVRSIKRKMGSEEKVRVGGKDFLPQEISALILRELAEWARRALGERPQRAVITVPAYFSDAQRNATREAGALAGLEVVRILNEPTAASLAYGYGDGSRHTVLIYDLGGGTFDVSVVTVEGDITEVLASHGNNHLGGDDFDDLLAERLAAEFEKQHGVDVRQGHPAAKARLWWAAEEAKKKLSFEPYAKIREEALVTRLFRPLHLEVEISRDEYEAMIRPLVESTLDSVSKALQDSGKKPGDMDAILLVGR